MFAIATVRSGQRYDAAVACLAQRLHVLRSNVQFLVLSDSPRPVACRGCRVVRVEAGRWCLSEANNIGIAEASNDVVLKIDADVQLLLPDDTLAGLARSVADGQAADVGVTGDEGVGVTWIDALANIARFQEGGEAARL